MVILNIFLVTVAVTLASAGVSQYYVTPYSQSILPLVQHSPPPLPLVHSQPFSASFLQNQFLNFPQVLHAPSTIVSHSFNPFVHQTYSIAQPSINFGQGQARTNSAKSLDTAPASPAGGSEYGFGYRTQYDDGASSMVVFVMGPESQKVEIGRSNNAASRKLSSGLLGGLNTDAEKSEEVGNALSNNISGLNIESLLEVYPIFKDLEQPKTSVFHLYSHPANVFQLPLPNVTPSSTSSSSSNPSPDLTNSDDAESVTIESADLTRSVPSDNQAREAESITEESKEPINNITAEISEENSQSSSTETASEASSASSSSTTPEESTEGSNDGVEATTSQ